MASSNAWLFRSPQWCTRSVYFSNQSIRTAGTNIPKCNMERSEMSIKIVQSERRKFKTRIPFSFAFYKLCIRYRRSLSINFSSLRYRSITHSILCDLRIAYRRISRRKVDFRNLEFYKVRIVYTNRARNF